MRTPFETRARSKLALATAGFRALQLINDDGLALFSALSPTPGGERPYPAIVPSVLLYGR
jgi:hypothetical protein